MDAARHLVVFLRYLACKLGKLYLVNDNLFTIMDALLRDSRWDMKFLGMQIMIEGLALGAFSMMYQSTREPLLKELLRYVIQDEARQVHYGVLALKRHFAEKAAAAEVWAWLQGGALCAYDPLRAKRSRSGDAYAENEALHRSGKNTTCPSAFRWTPGSSPPAASVATSVRSRAGGCRAPTSRGFASSAARTSSSRSSRSTTRVASPRSSRGPAGVIDSELCNDPPVSGGRAATASVVVGVDTSHVYVSDFC